MSEWTIEAHGSEYNARAEQIAADELHAVRDRAEARMRGKCPVCGGSREVLFTDTLEYEACPECTSPGHG